MAFDHQAAKILRSYRAVIVAGFRWINANIGQKGFADIHRSVRDAARHVNDALGSKLQHPTFAAPTIFQKQHAFATQTDIKLRRLPPRVEVAFGHEILAPDASWQQRPDRIMQITVAVARCHGRNPVDDGVTRFKRRLKCRGIGKAAAQITQAPSSDGGSWNFAGCGVKSREEFRNRYHRFQVRTKAFTVAHSLPMEGPCGRMVYEPMIAGTIKVSA